MFKIKHPTHRHGLGFPAFIVAILLIVATQRGAAIAQTQTYSDPVGFITLTTVSNGYSFIGLGMTRIPSLCGTVGTITGTQVPISSTLTAGQFNAVLIGVITNAQYYIENVTTNSAMAGFSDDIISNDAANVHTANGDSANFANGDSFKIYPHWTLNTVFGTQNQRGIVQGASTAASADSIIVWNPVTQNNGLYWYRTTGITPGWRNPNSTFTDVGNTPLYVDQGIQIQRKSAGTNINFALAGAVKLGNTITVVPSAGYAFVADMYAIGITLSNLNLYTGDPSTGVYGSNTLANADTLLLWDPVAQGTDFYWYRTSGITHGWRDGNSTSIDRGTNVFAAGSIFQIDRKNAPAFDWTLPAPYGETSSRCMAGDTCPIVISDIEQDASNNTIMTWSSCTNQVYGVFSSSDLSNWVGQTAMRGNNGTTSWTDTTTSGVTNRFYKVVRIPSDEGFNGDAIPSGWAVDNGLNPLDPTIDNQTSANPWAHGLTNLQVYQNPSVLIADNYSTLGDGIADWWRAAYYGNIGTPTNGTSCSSCNPCGLSNLQAFQCHLPPCVIITAPSPVCPDSTNNASIRGLGAGVTDTWTVANGSLLSGQYTSNITWIAGDAGTSTLSVVLMNGTNCVNSGSISIPIGDLSLDDTLPGGSTCSNYSGAIEASGGTGAYTYSLISGALPSGLSLSSGGIITGSPLTTGSFPFTVLATDANHCGSRAYNITIDDGCICSGKTVTVSFSGFTACSGYIFNHFDFSGTLDSDCSYTKADAACFADTFEGCGYSPCTNGMSITVIVGPGSELIVSGSAVNYCGTGYGYPFGLNSTNGFNVLTGVGTLTYANTCPGGYYGSGSVTVHVTPWP